MKIRALIGFTGALSLRDLISAGYVEPADPPEMAQPDETPPEPEPSKPKARKQSKKAGAGDENQ